MVKKIVFIVFLVFSVDFLDIFSEDYEEMIEGYEKHIVLLEDRLGAAKQDLYFREESYRINLQGIVENLYKEEVYEIGGRGIDVSSNVDSLYEVIMNATTDFSVLLGSIENYFDKRKEYIDTVPSIWPVRFDNSIRITSGYGLRMNPILGRMRFHEGIDIAGADKEIEIIATADGAVVENWIFHGIYGKMIIIEHPSGFTTLYAHMSRSAFYGGREVKRGDVIGWMGDTGKALGKHLHYEVRKDSQFVNPIGYLSSNRVLVMDR